MESRKPVSLTTVLLVCVAIGGVAVSFTTGAFISPLELEADNSTTTAHSETTTAHHSIETTISNHTEETTTAHHSIETTTSNHTEETTISNSTAVTTNGPTENTTHSNFSTTEPSTHNSTSEGPTSVAPHTSSVTSPVVSTTTTTTPAPGRKFDVASYFGGVATAVGLTVIVFVIVRFYNSRGKTRYNAM